VPHMTLWHPPTHFSTPPSRPPLSPPPHAGRGSNISLYRGVSYLPAQHGFTGFFFSFFWANSQICQLDDLSEHISSRGEPVIRTGRRVSPGAYVPAVQMGGSVRVLRFEKIRVKKKRRPGKKTRFSDVFLTGNVIAISDNNAICFFIFSYESDQIPQ
jgi:hypothetical protein